MFIGRVPLTSLYAATDPATAPPPQAAKSTPATFGSWPLPIEGKKRKGNEQQPEHEPEDKAGCRGASDKGIGQDVPNAGEHRASLLTSYMTRHDAPVSLPFAFKRRERPISLHRGTLELRTDGRAVACGKGTVSFTWRPQPGVRFVIPDQALFDTERDTTLVVAELGIEASVMLNSWNPTGGDVRGTINRAPFPPTESIRELRFAVPNYLFVNRGDRLYEKTPRTEHHWAGRHVLEHDGWRLTLDQRPDSGVVKDRLRTLSGYEITHTARLERSNDELFDDGAARDILVTLAHFFGLTRGLWAPPLLAHGYDEQGRIVWRDWNPPTLSPWRGTMNVIDVFHPESLQESFAGFLTRWSDPVWRDALLFGTQMYVEANGPVYAETSLVLTQAALELLAWVRIVEDEKSATADEFDKLQYGAAARIRRLFDWLNLDPAIPADLVALTSEAQRLGWHDGPHAIDALRNALIHPSKRARIEDTDLTARIELHELALWYVELALLRAIDFKGEYSSRLDSRWSGSVIAVPWSAT
jgi:hypothetical protein